MKRATASIIIALFALATIARAGDVEKSFDLLVKTDLVTNEAVGEGGDISEEARAFYVLFSAKNGPDKFRSLYDDAKTPAGKIWALAGLREMKDKRYDELRADFMKKEQKGAINWQRGCIMIKDQDPKKLLEKLEADAKFVSRIISRCAREKM